MNVSRMSLLLAGLLFSSPCLSTAGYLGTSITEFDVMGCKKNNANPRCKKIINVACQSICLGHDDDESDFGRACKSMCKLSFKSSKPEENKPQPR